MEPPDRGRDPFSSLLDAAETSADRADAMETNSHPGSAGGATKKMKKSVGFSELSGDAVDTQNRRRSVIMPAPIDTTMSAPPSLTISPANDSGDSTPSHHHHSRSHSGDMLAVPNRSHLPVVSQEVTDQLRAALSQPGPPRPRPALRRGDSSTSVNLDSPTGGRSGADTPQTLGAKIAYEKALRLERDERIRSEPASRRTSPTGQERIPLRDLSNHHDRDGSDDDELDMYKERHNRFLLQAKRLVRSHTRSHNTSSFTQPSSGFRSGAATPTEEFADYEFHIQPPPTYRSGVLGTLLKLYNSQSSSSSKGNRNSFALSSAASTPGHSPTSSGTSTPLYKPKWHSPKRHHSNGSLAHLVGSATMGASPAVTGLGAEVAQRLREQEAERKRLSAKRATSSSAMAALSRIGRTRLDNEVHITVHIAETIARQKYLLRLCRALMQYGAPTHRLEEYMKMSARVLQIEAQFLYIPGSMIISFDDSETHTTEVKLIRVNQGLDLGKLRDVHEVYKNVCHDRVGVVEATKRLTEVMTKAPKHNKWVLIPVYGLASASVGPFAFSARVIDLPIAFVLGCILGTLQLVIAPSSDLYSNVFEISAAVITSFLARAFGSILYNGERLFCFSALAQSAIAMILPGYTVLCASLELQSRSLVAGSVRMVYAIIYSLFLGFGITIGTAIYGLLDRNAVSSTTCRDPIPEYWFFFSVPIFTLCLIVINQAKWKQAPVMMVIAFVGYIVNYFSAKRFAGNTQISNTLGALAIGVMANLYSRLGKRTENRILDIWEDHLRPRFYRIMRRSVRNNTNLTAKVEAAEAGEHIDTPPPGGASYDSEGRLRRHTRKVGYGLAAAAMLPAIFVQVPSGLAVSGSLVSGLASANQITGNATNGTSVVNSTSIADGSSALNSVAFNVGYSVIQVAIGITVGLFLSAIIVYPFGKRRSGLFSF